MVDLQLGLPGKNRHPGMYTGTPLGLRETPQHFSAGLHWELIPGLLLQIAVGACLHHCVL